MTSSKTHAVVTTACIAIAIASMLPIGSRDARAQNPGSAGVGLSSCNLMVGSETTDFLVCQPMGKNDLNNVYAANAQTRVYADAGQLVRFTALTLPGGASGALRGFASGYDVPAP